MQKRVTFFSNFRKSLDNGDGKGNTFTTGGHTHKATKTDVHKQSMDIIYSKVRSYTNPIEAWDSFVLAQTSGLSLLLGGAWVKG